MNTSEKANLVALLPLCRDITNVFNRDGTTLCSDAQHAEDRRNDEADSDMLSKK
jgi:hypothetical protein